MKPITMYPMITQKNKFFGLEWMDLLGLLAVYLMVFLSSKNLMVNLSVVFVVYLFLTYYKRNKADRFTKNLIRYFFMPAYFTQTREEA